MTSYRFCRSDDIPLLVDAHNRCYRPADADVDLLTVDRFKQLIREVDLWTSSCMVAMAGDDPIAVVLAAKRETENWIYRVAVHPDHRRQGHGQHLLTSLSQKMAILGPPRLLLEAPLSDPGLLPFFEACDYQQEVAIQDFRADPLPEAPEPPPILQPVKLTDLSDLVRDHPERSWGRRLSSLRHLGDELDGYAVTSDRRIEAFALFRDLAAAAGREVLAIQIADPAGPETDLGSEADSGLVGALLAMLLIQLRRTATGPVLLPRVEDQEIGSDHLLRCGFEPAESYARLAATATPL